MRCLYVWVVQTLHLAQNKCNRGCEPVQGKVTLFAFETLGGSGLVLELDPDAVTGVFS